MCDCIEQVDATMEKAGENTTTDPLFLIRIKDGVPSIRSRFRLAVVKLDDKKRKKPVAITPNFCPMCGQSYETMEANDAVQP